jgi:hypothetical protein
MPEPKHFQMLTLARVSESILCNRFSETWQIFPEPGFTNSIAVDRDWCFDRTAT